jgi:hypothetical protein
VNTCYGNKLEVLLEQIAADAFQVVPHELGKTTALLLGEVIGTLEQRRPGLGQDWWLGKTRDEPPHVPVDQPARSFRCAMRAGWRVFLSVSVPEDLVPRSPRQIALRILKSGPPQIFSVPRCSKGCVMKKI